jgi:hypothetical protein
MLDAAYLTLEEHHKMLAFVAQTGRWVSGLIRTTQRRTASA